MSVYPHVLAKASNRAPFVFLLLLFCLPLQAQTCSPARFDETVQVEYVYDGDTVKLRDGRKVRLIGVNTPEHGRDGQPDEPYYRETRQQLQNIITASQNRVKLVYGQQRQDRHRRLLAHLFTLDGSNISRQLLKSGMGFMIAISPNTRFLNCYQQAEKQARRDKKGIWSHPFSQAIAVEKLAPEKTGFAHVMGTVQRIGESRTSFWLNLSPRFALRIMKKDLPYFRRYHPRKLLHKKIIARGWIYKTKREQRISIRHPAAIEEVATD